MKKTSSYYQFCNLIVLLLCLLSFNTRAQESPYQLKWEMEVPIFSIATSAEIAAFLLHKKRAPLTEADIKALDPLKVPRFDQYSMGRFNLKAAKASDVLLFTAPFIPFALLASDRINDDLGHFGAIYAETFLLNAALTNLTKELADRKRPFVYYPDAPLAKKQHHDAQSSFFSGHTSAAATSMFFLAKYHHDYFPDSKAGPYVWASCATVPAIMGLLRCRAGKHFPSDVIVGYLVGAAIGILVPELHKIDVN